MSGSHAVSTESARARIARVASPVGRATAADPSAVREHLDALTKPRGSLGHLEALALRLALIYGDPPPPLRRRVTLVIAADHGVAACGVSAYPSQVTAQMCRNYAAGGAVINAIARAVGADVVVVDVGVDAEPADLPGIVSRKLRRGSRDLSTGPALTLDETAAAIELGAHLVAERAQDADVFALGDMGIANTTAASALTAALLGATAERVVGLGTGIDEETLWRKREIVARAVRRLAGRADPMVALTEVGGLEIAALTGVLLGAARAGRAVVTDGFVTTAAALAALRICPAAGDYLFASHRSAEPGHTLQLEALGLEPIFDLGMRLGEGTGATLALPILEAAAAVLRETATFTEAGVSGEIAPPQRAHQAGSSGLRGDSSVG